MNFMWDMAIRAGEQGRPEQELFFCQAKEYSPFFEPAFPCLNETKVENGRIELNLLYRFADIFQDILAWEGEDRETGAYAQFREFFIDAVLHAILYTDLRDGLTRRTFGWKLLSGSGRGFCRDGRRGTVPPGISGIEPDGDRIVPGYVSKSLKDSLSKVSVISIQRGREKADSLHWHGRDRDRKKPVPICGNHVSAYRV